jgi:DNA-binding CsgD family transcriptional regulator
MQMQSGIPAYDDEARDVAGAGPCLSPREQEILTLVAQGRTDNEIAMQLCLSAKTVSWYVKRLRSRLGASSRAHAVALALQQGLLSATPTPTKAP